MIAEPDPTVRAAETAAPLVTRALAVCEEAGLELAEMLLRDVLDVLTDDYPSGSRPGGGEAGRPRLSSPLSHGDGDEDASPPPTL